MSIPENIPKIIHLSWKQKDICDNQSPLILNGLRNLIDLNPDWSVVLSDDRDVDLYLKENLSASDFRQICEKKMAEKTDLWRLLKVYNEGGLYIDIDRYYNIPLSEIISADVKCVLPTYLDFDFSQDFMLSAPKNPIYQEAIKLNTERRRAGSTEIYFLGAQTYMHAVSKVLLGKIVNSDPGREAFEEIRAVIQSMPFIKTYRENPPYDTIVYKHDKNTFKTGNGKSKEEFYKECGVAHWTE